MSEKVVVRGSDGYADPDYSGVIVDGTWQGVDPSGGSYRETYRIKRDRGGYFDAGYFDAEEHTLLRRFDSDAELRDERRDVVPSQRERSHGELVGAVHGMTDARQPVGQGG